MNSELVTAYQFPMTINGKAILPDETFDVVNPATGESFAQAPDCSPEQLDEAVQSAATAFLDWRQDEDVRRTAMRAAAQRLNENRDELAHILTQEQGKPLADSVMEIMGAAYWLSYYADLETPIEVLQEDEAVKAELHWRPLGPVAAITPWNVPITLALWKIAPALRAGNTVIVKPSPYTPLATLRMGQILAEILPPGVLNVVSGQDPLGSLLTNHPLVRKVTFTGSTETGKKVAVAAAQSLKRITLELGGNDAAIVLDDADPQAVAAGLFGSAMANSGQICVAVKRAYVPRAIFDDVVTALGKLAKSAVVGDGLTEGVKYGPLNNRPQLERVRTLVDDAVEKGATIVAQASIPDGDGYFYAPTILAGVDDSMAIVAEEQFGPVLPVVVYDDLDDAIKRANATDFGLGSSIWTQDAERGAALAERLEAGTTWINAHSVLGVNRPFGGTKSSGIGLENGIWGLREFTDAHVIYQQRASIKV